MKSLKKGFLMLMVCLTLVLVAEPICSEAAVPKLNRQTVSITVGKTVQLTVKNTKAKVKWSSSNKKIATVTGKGKVKAKKAGKATITAKVGKKSFKCKVTVKKRRNVDKKYTIELGKGRTKTVVGHFDTKMADEIFQRLNAYRSKKGLRRLAKGNEALQKMANTRACEIVEKFDHKRPNGKSALIPLDETTYCFAENIARFQSSAAQVMQDWKDSPGHNEVMLAPDARSVGIGVFAEKRTSGRRTYYYYHFVQLFTLYVDR